jgi:thioester reductase-like protein
MESILDRVEDWAGENPARLLYSFLDLSGTPSESYSYEAFLARTKVIAGYLRAEHGFAPNDRLLLAYPAGLEMICAFFGCVRAGLIPVPVYPPSSHAFHAALNKMVHIARDCGAAGVLTSGDYRDSIETNLARNRSAELPADAASVLSLKWIVTEDMREPVTSAGSWRDGGDIVFLQYTSGSTSNPRGVMVTHSNILENCRYLDVAYPVGVSWLPQYHDMGLIGYYLYSALKGGTTYGFSPLDFIQRPALWLETMTKYGAVSSSAPNFAFEYLLRPGRISQETIENTDLSSLKYLMTAAEPVKPAIYTKFLQAYRRRGLKPEVFFVAYGLAENTLAVTSHGRNVLSVNKHALALRSVRVTSEVSEISSARQIMSCGEPVEGVVVRIVDPEKHVALEDGNVGEIWIRGSSKCKGYWNNRPLTEKTFHARIVGESQHDEDYLRTGDMGFMYRSELYVCGRNKDMIIVRGQNYYPQDIEHVVEETSELVRKTCVAAFEINEDREPALAVVIEAKTPKTLPDPREIVVAIRSHLNLDAALIAIIAPRSVPKTSSGKVMRHMAKQMWLEGKFKVLAQFSRETEPGDPSQTTASSSPFEALKTRYHLQGDENWSLIEAGVDSVDLVGFMHGIKELLKEKGAGMLASQVDIALIQQITVAELFRLAELFERSPEAAIARIRGSLAGMREEHRLREARMMTADTRLNFQPAASHSNGRTPEGILLTGGTGFFGPFLMKSLLEQTEDPLYVLIRAENESRARDRLKGGLGLIAPSAEILRKFEQRVIPVCGDLALSGLGLPDERWQFLSKNVHTIYHNGAVVNYLFNYEKMRAANVLGTNEILKLAFDRRHKIFNLISTTFIFGWAVKEVLFETDSNDRMELLDFGYSQSKWVSERIVMDAARHGLRTRMFRPALVSPSVAGRGNNLDIAIRLLAFMVNHGIGVTALNQVSFMPADVAANNIVAISNIPETVNASYHVTRDDYANMVDVTDIITRATGRQFEMFNLKDFVPEVIRRCTREDPLFPLLDFLIGSIDSISSMEFKRYDSSGYQKWRDAGPRGLPDPSLDDTVCGILRFMQRKGLIATWAPELDEPLIAEPGVTPVGA